MTRVNGSDAIAEIDEAGETLRKGAKGEGDQNDKMIAHCNAFFARRRMTINEGGFFRRQPGKRTKPVLPEQEALA